MSVTLPLEFVRSDATRKQIQRCEKNEIAASLLGKEVFRNVWLAGTLVFIVQHPIAYRPRSG